VRRDSRTSRFIDWLYYYWKPLSFIAVVGAFVLIANWPSSQDPLPPVVYSPPTTATTTTLPPSTTSTLSAAALAELEASWQEVWAEMQADSRAFERKYAANQYGCHSDGRCLDDNDEWCDEDDYNLTPNGDWFCYWEPDW